MGTKTWVSLPAANWRQEPFHRRSHGKFQWTKTVCIGRLAVGRVPEAFCGV